MNFNEKEKINTDMYPDAKVPISCRVAPYVKTTLIEKSIEFDFKTFSQYLEFILEKSIGSPHLNKLSQHDINLIKSSIRQEYSQIKENETPAKSEDYHFQQIQDKAMESIIPIAASSFFKKYSTDNFTKEDLKTCLYNYLEQKIQNKDNDLISLIRSKLE